jgi:hypothetical protein
LVERVLTICDADPDARIDAFLRDRPQLAAYRGSLHRLLTDHSEAVRSDCARISIDISRAKQTRATREGAPPTYLAAVQATGADIEDAIRKGQLS